MRHYIRGAMIGHKMLTDPQLERYARHIVLKEIGGAGQVRLMGADIAVIGAGGLGCPAIAYLAAAGVGTLRIIDNDHVDLSNLQRQTLFGTEDVGRSKAEAAVAAVRRLNPNVQAIAVTQRIDVDNAEQLLGGASPVLDGCDNFVTRLTVADAAMKLRVPLVSAAVGSFEGQVAVYRGWHTNQPCYRCLVGHDPGREEQNCAETGILGALTGTIGALAALEAIRAIVPFGEPMAGKLLVADLLSMRFRTLSLPKDPRCLTCGSADEDAIISQHHLSDPLC